MIGVWNYTGYAKNMLAALKEMLATHGITMEYVEPSASAQECITTISFTWENGVSSSSNGAYIAEYKGSVEDTVFTCMFNTDTSNPFVTITNNSSKNYGEIYNTSHILACLICGMDIGGNVLGSWFSENKTSLDIVCNVPQMVLASGVTGGLLVTNLVRGLSLNNQPKVAKNIYIISNGYKLTPNQILVDSTGTKKMLSVGSVFLVEYNDEEIVVL